MTLIIGACTREAALIVSDMRLSWNGQVRHDETVKAGYFRTTDARVIFAYTGLAEWKVNDPAKSFNTLAWLTRAIFECLGPSKSIGNVLAERR